jgi:hypothetical protein
MVSFMIFTASVQNVLDTFSYTLLSWQSCDLLDSLLAYGIEKVVESNPVVDSALRGLSSVV